MIVFLPMWDMGKDHFVAFDFGTRKIGVAVGQVITLTATPLPELRANQGVPNWSHIAALLSTWKPAGWVVGIPLNMDATPQSITFKAKRFAALLQEKFALPVYPVDERLTTVEARNQLYALGGYKALQTVSVDSFAAKLILESFLRNIAPKRPL